MHRRNILTTAGVAASLALCAGIVVGAPGCTTPAPAAEPINADLAHAIARHRVALEALKPSVALYETCERALKRLDTPETRAAFDAADAAFQIDCETEGKAHFRVLGAPIKTMADMRAKAAHLARVAQNIAHDDETVAVLLASMGANADDALAMSIVTPDMVEPDPFVERMRRYAAEIQAYNADPDPSDDDAEPSGSLLAELESGALKIGSIAGAVMAMRQVVAIDATRDVEAQALIAETLAFLEGRA